MGLFSWFKAPSPTSPELAARAESVAAAVAPHFPAVRDHLPRLMPAIAAAWRHCREIAARIPGPLAIDRAAFANDPLIHALFPTVEDIAAMLGKSQCVRENYPRLALHGDSCHALLGLRLAEKRDLGWVEQNGQLVADSMRRLVYFTDHTLSEPAAEEAQTRLRVAERLFTGLLAEFNAQCESLRQEIEALRVEAEFARARRRRGIDDGNQGSASHDELAQRLAQLTPQQLADRLEQTLHAASERLRLTPLTLHVDRSGMVRELADDATTTIELARLRGRDRRQWIVFIVAIRHDEIRAALERFAAANRYIVI